MSLWQVDIDEFLNLLSFGLPQGMSMNPLEAGKKKDRSVQGEQAVWDFDLERGDTTSELKEAGERVEVYR